MSERFRLAQPDQAVLATRAAELLAQCREDARQRRRTIAGGVLSGFMAWAAGLGLMSWAVHTTDPKWAGIAFSFGLLVGNVGVVTAMIWIHGRLGRLDG